MDLTPIDGMYKTRQVAHMAGISRQAVKHRALALVPPAVPVNTLGTDMWSAADAKRIVGLGVGHQHRLATTTKKKAPKAGASKKKSVRRAKKR
jgi:hypothetical protein